MLKALGEGISFGLDRVAFALDADGVPSRVATMALEAGAPSEWRLARIDPAPGYVGALAWRGRDRQVRRSWPAARPAYSGEGRNPFCPAGREKQKKGSRIRRERGREDAAGGWTLAAKTAPPIGLFPLL